MLKLPEDPKERATFIRIAIGDIVYGGEFANWLNNKTMPIAAIKEIDELQDIWYDLLREEFGNEYVRNLIGDFGE
jgi:hypothetical protein